MPPKKKAAPAKPVEQPPVAVEAKPSTGRRPYPPNGDRRERFR